jgi:hypothetical protein
VRYTIDAHKQRTDRVQVDDIDFGEFRRRPLDPATLRCLRYMHDVEHHTICYLRDVLVTQAHQDVEITTFLSFWAFEEYWHGEALGRVLEAHGDDSEARVESHRARLDWHDRILPVATFVASKLTPHVPAVHLAWGAVNEWTTQAAYGLLARKAEHPTLTLLLGRIMKQEGRHIDFYASRASDRLQASRTARRLARWAFRNLWSPVGAGLMPEDEVQFLASHLFGDAPGAEAVARIDRRIDRLPGLDGLALVSGARDRYARPASSTRSGERPAARPVAA